MRLDSYDLCRIKIDKSKSYYTTQTETSLLELRVRHYVLRHFMLRYL